MGELHHFLGVKVTQLADSRIWIGQSTYTREILKKFNMEKLKPVATPVETGIKLVKTIEEDELFDQETINQRLDVSYTCQQKRDLILRTLWEMLQDSQQNHQHGLMYGKESSPTGYLMQIGLVTLMIADQNQDNIKISGHFVRF